MNWKKIAKHVFFAPLYAAIIGLIGLMMYGLFDMSVSFYMWASSNWILHIPITFLFLWAFAIVMAILHKMGMFDA